MAIATPGRVSEMSERARATEPTAPVASAATRSTIRGVTLAATWLLVAATMGYGASAPSSHPTPTTSSAPATHEQHAATQVRAVGEHDRQDDPQDRRHQRRDDHCADHGCRGVGDDARRGDHSREAQQEPVAAQAMAAFGTLEEQLVAHAIDVELGEAGEHVCRRLRAEAGRVSEPSRAGEGARTRAGGRGPTLSGVGGRCHRGTPFHGHQPTV